MKTARVGRPGHGIRRRRSRDPPGCRRRSSRRGPRRQGEGAAGRRVRLLPGGADPLHVPAPRGRRGARAALAERGSRGVAYETVEHADGSLPLLAPDERGRGPDGTQVGAAASKGRTAARACCSAACRASRRGAVVILGGGVVGRNAAPSPPAWARRSRSSTAHRPAALPRRHLRRRDPDASTRASRHREARAASADLVVGAVLVAGARGAQARHASQVVADAARARWSSTSRSIRADASRPAGRPRTTTRPMRWTASCTTAWPTCRAPCRALHVRAHERHAALRAGDRDLGLEGAVRSGSRPRPRREH